MNSEFVNFSCLSYVMCQTTCLLLSSTKECSIAGCLYCIHSRKQVTLYYGNKQSHPENISDSLWQKFIKLSFPSRVNENYEIGIVVIGGNVETSKTLARKVIVIVQRHRRNVYIGA